MVDIKSYFLRTLSFLRIVDPFDNNLSLTNIALFVVLYKLFKSTDTSIVDLGGLFVGLTGYNLKKYMNQDIMNAVSNNKIVQKAQEIVKGNE